MIKNWNSESRLLLRALCVSAMKHSATVLASKIVVSQSELHSDDCTWSFWRIGTTLMEFWLYLPTKWNFPAWHLSPLSRKQVLLYQGLNQYETISSNGFVI